MNLESELDELLRQAGWAGMSWDALITKYANMTTPDALKATLNRLIARKSIYRFLRPCGPGRIRHGVSTIYYSYWPVTAPRTETRTDLVEATLEGRASAFLI